MDSGAGPLGKMKNNSLFPENQKFTVIKTYHFHHFSGKVSSIHTIIFIYTHAALIIHLSNGS